MAALPFPRRSIYLRPVRNVYGRVTAALGVMAALYLVGAVLLYAYSLTMDVSTTTSNQNLVQFWAGALLRLAIVLGALSALWAGLAVFSRQVRSSRRAKEKCRYLPAAP